MISRSYRQESGSDECTEALDNDVQDGLDQTNLGPEEEADGDGRIDVAT